MEISEAKILIISNNPLSLTNSNGRTLYNLVSSFRKDQLYNFFISGDNLLLDKVNYYQISDNDVIHSICKKGNIGRSSFTNDNSGNITPSYQKKKTITKVMIRDMLWNRKSINKEILEWAKTFNPNVILFQVGDSIFLMRIAIYLANTLDIPIITYNSEDYFFKNFNYIKKTLKSDHLYRKWHLNYQRTFNELISLTTDNIYLTDDLKELYDNEFPYSHSKVIYNPGTPLSAFDFTKEEIEASKERLKKCFVYSGNLGVGRLDELIKVANAIKEVDPTYDILVYSKADKETIDKINECKSLKYMGFVSYKENILIINTCYCILHVESFDPFYREDTKHAFSTKIGDLVKSSNKLFICAPKSSSVSKLFIRYDYEFLCNENNYEFIHKYIKNIFNLDFCENSDLKDKFEKNMCFNDLILKGINQPLFEILVSTTNQPLKLLDEVGNIKKEYSQLLKHLNIKSNVIIRNQILSETIMEKGNFESTFFANGYCIKLFSTTNEKGLSNSRNTLLSKTYAKYIMFIDDDLILSKDYLNYIFESIKSLNFDSLEYSLTWGETHFKLFKNGRNYFYKHSGAGILNILFRKSYLLKYHLEFNKKFGTGSDFYCGEDTIFRRWFFKFSKKHFTSSNFIEDIPPTPSSWFKNEDEKYFNIRSIVYGYTFHFLCPLLLLRMKIKSKNPKEVSLKKCMQYCKIGHKLYLDDKKSRKCYYK